MGKYVVSACLAGMPCRYDGTAKPVPYIVNLARQGLAMPVCPEVLAGLTTPRLPCECRRGRIICINGADLTNEFIYGAKAALHKAKLANCICAILKSKSPSCGMGLIYDGYFRNRLCKGNGIFAEMLLQSGIEVITEEDIKKGPVGPIFQEFISF